MYGFMISSRVELQRMNGHLGQWKSFFFFLSSFKDKSRRAVYTHKSAAIHSRLLSSFGTSFLFYFISFHFCFLSLKETRTATTVWIIKRVAIVERCFAIRQTTSPKWRHPPGQKGEPLKNTRHSPRRTRTIIQIARQRFRKRNKLRSYSSVLSLSLSGGWKTCNTQSRSLSMSIAYDIYACLWDVTTARESRKGP